MVDFRSLLDPKTRAELEAFEDDKSELESLSNKEFGAKLIHYYHNCDESIFSPGEPVYDGQMYWLLIPEMIRRLYDGEPPEHCPCEGCTCSNWCR